MTVDRRLEVRRTVNREFSTAEEFASAYVSNLSRHGMFIRSDEPLPVGTRVTLRCTVILDDMETIEGVGEVVRVVAKGSSPHPGMGVVFVELTAESRRLIERILVHR